METPRVDFYLLASNTDEARLQTVCKLAEKAYFKAHNVFIYTDEAAHAQALNEKLWTYKDTSFIPHSMITESITPAPPIQIGYHDHVPTTQHDILINLATQIPDCHKHFKRILEIVTNDPQQKKTLRDHYRYYRDQEYPLDTHELG